MITNKYRVTLRRAALLASALSCTALTPVFAQAVPTPNANQYGPGLIGAPAAWALGYTGQGVIVTVGDSGIDPNHPAFAGKIDPRSRSFVLATQGATFDAAAINDPDAQSHGTHVGGIVASSAASGVPGIAYNANLLVLKMIGGCGKGQSCTAPGIPNASQAALDYFAAQTGTMIYNASYGPDLDKGTTVFAANTIDSDEAAALQRALAAGKIIVAASGNDRDTSPVAGANPNGMALDPFIQPGNANAGVYLDGGNRYDFSGLLKQPGLVVAVTSVGQAKTIASYAQTCGVTASWCVAAPGGNQAVDAGIYSTLPNNTYGYLQGTSMAAPTVSGALAVLQQAYPAYAARDLANTLFATAENVGGKLADNATYGYGLIRLDRAVAGPTSLAAGSIVNVAAQQVTYWSQPLTTTGGFTVAGPGYLVIAGRTAATGDVNVTGGALGVDGTLTLATTLNVAQGAMLAGFGQITGNSSISGTLNAGQLPNYADVIANSGGSLPAGTPLTGTSPGTLTFQGNVTLGAAATTRANIDGTLIIPGGPGTYDKIIVTGAGNTFTANGALVPVLRGIPGGNNNFTPAAGAMFPIITAQNGAAVAGQFVSITQPTAGLAANTRLDVVYAATAITLNVTPLNFQVLAAQQTLDPNAQAVAGALDTARPAPGVRSRPAAAPLYNDLYDNSVAEDDSELGALSGEGIAAHAISVLAAFNDVSELVAGRQMNLSPSNAGWSIWAQGLGRWSRTGMDMGIAGAADTASGFGVGADLRLSGDLVLGGAFSFYRTDTDSAAAVATTDTYSAAAYATWTSDRFTLDGRVAVGRATGDTSRLVVVSGVTDIVLGKPDGWGFLGAMRAGYRLDVPGLDIEPYAGLTLQTYRQQAYNETTVVGLSFLDQDFSRARTLLGARFGIDTELAGFHLRPQAEIAWSHDMGDAGWETRAEIFATPFLIDAARPGRDAARVRAGVSAWQDASLSFFVGYEGEFHGNATSHGVTGGIHIGL